MKQSEFRHAATPATSPISDFNGDGYTDLAVGVPFEDVGTLTDAGAVSVIYGSANGLTAQRNQFWTQNSKGVADRSEAGDQFGQGLASGDFNADGYVDLAVGAPFEDVGSRKTDAGAVNVLYGGPNGLQTASPVSQYFTESSTGIAGNGARKKNLFGASLAAGDFNGDGIDDLAIGVRNEPSGSSTQAGAVIILYGSSSGLTTTGSQFFTQDTPGMLGLGSQTGAVWSRGLGAGDFNGDGFADLAVGAWTEDVNGVKDTGAVNVIYGSASGLTVSGNQFITESPLEQSAWFGKPLTAADFNGDGYDDLVASAHQHSAGGAPSAGEVDVFYGSPTGLQTSGYQVWTEDATGVGDGSEAGDHFGRTTSTGDINTDGYPDLAIGVTDEAVGAISDTGAAVDIFGGPSGLSPAGSQYWTQDSPGILDQCEAGDEFGWYVQLGDFNGDGRADLASAPAYEDIGSIPDAGAVNVIYGTASGLDSAGNQFWYQGNNGLKDTAEAGDTFGVVMG